MTHVKKAPHIVQHNGTTEGMKIKDKVRSMLFKLILLKKIVRVAHYLINHSCTTLLDGEIFEKYGYVEIFFVVKHMCILLKNKGPSWIKRH